MKKLTLSLAMTSLLYLSSPSAMGDIVSGFDALIAGEGEQAYQHFVAESESDSNAAFIVGMFYYYGVGVPQNDQQATRWLLKAAEAGNAEALYNLGYLRLAEKLPVTEKDRSGLELLLAASDAGIEDAVILLAINMIEEEGVPATFFTEALRDRLFKQLTEILAENGPNAGLAGMILASLSIYSFPFNDSEPNYPRAVALLEESYAKGFMPAVLGLATLYSEGGYGLEIDPIKAATYEAIILENFAIFTQLTDLFPKEHSFYRIMTPEQYGRYLTNLESAGTKGSVPALLQLIYHYEGGEGSEKDPAKVAHYREMLAHLGTGEAWYALGLMQVEENDSQAKQSMQLAAKEEYLPAIHWLSDSFNYGWNDDSSMIAQYELQGARLGDSRSIKAVVDRLYDELSNVGWWNESSRPLAIIEKELYEWLIEWQRVAPNESQPYLELAEAYKQGLGVTKDPKMALKMLLQGIDNVASHQQLLLDLADYYRLGFGVERDPSAAMGYYLQSEAMESTLQGLEGVIALYLESDGFQQILPSNSDHSNHGKDREDEIKARRADLSPITLLELYEVALTPALAEKIALEATQKGALLSDEAISTLLFDHLLDRLELLLGIEGYESRYSYLLADRYMAQYWTLLAQVKEDHCVTEDQAEALNHLLELASSYYRGASDLSEQAHLHAAEAEIALAKVPMLLASGEMGVDEAVQERYLRAASHNLQQIQTLFLTEAELAEAFLDLQENFDDRSRFLNSDETDRAYQSLFQVIEELPALQSWYGEQLIPSNPAAFEALKTHYEAKAGELPEFAQYYIARNQIMTGDGAGYLIVQKLAKNHYLPALYQLADRYWEEDALLIATLGGSQQDRLFWLEQAAQLGEDEALYQLAEIYYEQNAPTLLAPGESDRQAILYYQQLSDPDYRFAKYHLREAEERLERYEAIQQGVAQNDAEALYLQSQIYRYGEYGALIDLEKADALLIEAAEAGSIAAIQAYYNQYAYEMTLDEVTRERFNRYHIIYVEITHRDWETQRLADRYLKGDRIAESREKARYYYQFALENDPNSSASYDLRQMDAFDHNILLAQKGNGQAMLEVGRAYQNGMGVKEDQKLAYEWLQRAAESGDRDAAFYFGVIAQEGVIDQQGTVVIAPNWELALAWYDKASPRFKGAIEGRVERYESLYQPAAAGDPTALLALGDHHAQQYRSDEGPYDLSMAHYYYEAALQKGELKAELALLQLLEGEERADYLERLLKLSDEDERYQQPDFQVALMAILVAQSQRALDASSNEAMDARLDLEQLQFAITQLQAIAAEERNETATRIAALRTLLALYQRDYKIAGEQMAAPGFEKSYAIALELGKSQPIVKRLLAETRYAQREKEAQAEALQLWQEAGEEGDYISLIQLYRHLLPRTYDKVSLADLDALDSLSRQYLAIAPEYPIGPTAYQEFIKRNDEIEGILDNSARAEICLMLAELWQENGIDFIGNPQKAHYWYQQSLKYTVDNKVVAKLLKQAESEYAALTEKLAPSASESRIATSAFLYSTPYSLPYLMEIYLYGATLEQLSALDYPFDLLTPPQRFALSQLAERYQNRRDYPDQWVIVETLQDLDAGNHYAAYRMGEYYLNGRYIRPNLEKALYYYQLAGELGIADAYNRLGNLYREEQYGITPDYVKALSYFEKGAALGDSNTAHLAGDLLYFGIGGITPDYQRAFDYYDQTDLMTGSHHALAKYKQAEILYRGLLKPMTLEDFAEAQRLLLVAAQHGNSLAIEALKDWSYEAGLAASEEAAAEVAEEIEMEAEPEAEIK